MRLLAAGLLMAMAGCAGAPPVKEDISAWGYRADEDMALANLAKARGFTGHLAISRRAGSFHMAALRDPMLPGNDDVWPWASVTKQVVATLVMQQVEAGTIQLEAPALRYLNRVDGKLSSPTIRQLLRHQSGLRNPDDSEPDAAGFPSFYTTGSTGLDWCLAERAAPVTDNWRYNNCDYIVLGAILEKVADKPIGTLFAENIAGPADMKDTAFSDSDSTRAFIGANADYRATLARYGASAGLAGTLEDMILFDRALLDGTLLGAEARDEMWSGDPALGYMGLGQWAFSAPLSGCAEQIRIIERRGGVGKYQVRNFILPEKDLLLALATEDGEYDFGEIWIGSGVSYDLLSLAACGEKP